MTLQPSPLPYRPKENKTDNLEIPDFLKRAKESIMTETHEKKKRNKTLLPALIQNGAETIVLSDLDLDALVFHRNEIMQKLSEAPRLSLELRAVNTEIRRKAK